MRLEVTHCTGKSGTLSISIYYYTYTVTWVGYDDGIQTIDALVGKILPTNNCEQLIKR